MLIELDNYFDKNDWGHLHDVVFDVSGHKVNQGGLEKLWLNLPRDIQGRSIAYGLSDTEVRDEIYELYKYHTS